MKSAVFYGKHEVRIEERPMPETGPEEVLIQVKACGVCGTDVHIYEGDKGAAEVTPPTILGHEFSGVVVNRRTGHRFPGRRQSLHRSQLLLRSLRGMQKRCRSFLRTHDRIRDYGKRRFCGILCRELPAGLPAGG